MTYCYGKYFIAHGSTCALCQELVWLAQRKRRFLKAPWSLMVPLSFASFVSPWYLFPSRCWSLTAQMWSTVENSFSPLNEQIRLQIAPSELVYFSATDDTGFCRPSPYFFIRNILRAPTIQGRVFDTPKKTWGKKISLRTFSNPSNACSVYFFTCCKKNHLDWITRANVA